MSTAKTAIATGAIVIAIASAPMIWQESRISKLRNDLSELEERRTEVELQRDAERNRAAAAFELSAHAAPARTVRELVTVSEKPITVDDLLGSLMEVMMSQDIVGMLKVFLPIANLSPDEYERLMGELEDYKGNARAKQMALQMLGMFAPAQNPSEALERMIRLGVETHAYANLLDQWAGDDPDAALEWYNAKLEAGELAGKGINNTPSTVLFGHLLGGMAKQQPDRAIDLYAQLRADEPNAASRALWNLARGLGSHAKEDGDDSSLRRLIEINANDEERQTIVRAALHSAIDRDDFGAAVAFIDRHIDDVERRRSLLVGHAANNHRAPVAEKVDQLVAHLPADQAPVAVGEFVERSYWRSGAGEIEQWVESQPAGAIRDHGLKALANRLARESRFDEASTAIDQIGDAELQSIAVKQLDSRRQRHGVAVEGHDHGAEATAVEEATLEQATDE